MCIRDSGSSVHRRLIQSSAIQRNAIPGGVINGGVINGEMCIRDRHLHARSLVFPHPAGGTMRVEANLPPHMVETFQTLGFAASPALPPRREGS